MWPEGLQKPQLNQRIEEGACSPSDTNHFNIFQFDEKFISDSYLHREKVALEEQIGEDGVADMGMVEEDGAEGLVGRKESVGDVRWRKLKLLSKYHICQICSELIAQSQIDWRWENYIQKFVIKAVDSVKPSSRYLKDSMDFNQYVDIQIVDSVDETMSQYVNGCVLLKNLAEKSMRKYIKDPKILLLWGSLGFMKNYEDGPAPQSVAGTARAGGQPPRQSPLYMDINSVISQEDQYVEILKQKLDFIQPDVLITEKEISFKVLEVLKERGIAAISNVSEKQLLTLARLTQTIIAPSANVIDQSFQMGRCKVFRVEDPSRYNIQKNKGVGNFLREDDQINSFTRPIYTPKNQFRSNNLSVTRKQDQPTGSKYLNSLAEIDLNKQIIFFEGCNHVLGCTILLSGPISRSNGYSSGLESAIPSKQFVDLLRIKTSLRKMLHISRNIILERDFLDHLKIDPNIDLNSLELALATQKQCFGMVNKNKVETFTNSPFLVTRIIKNRSTLVLYKTMIKKGQSSQKNEQSILNKINSDNKSNISDEVMTFSPNPQTENEPNKYLQQPNEPKKRDLNRQKQQSRDSNDPKSPVSHSNSRSHKKSRERSRSPNLQKAQISKNEGQRVIKDGSGRVNQNAVERSKDRVVDEHFVKTKSDAMCGKPRKIKFQFYNISMQGYDQSIYQQAMEHLGQGPDTLNRQSDLMTGSKSEQSRMDLLNQLKETCGQS